MESECGIYKIVNKVNGKIYVGLAENIEERWKKHVRSLKKGKHCNNHLQHTWNKYGKDSFTFEIVEICDIENLNKREIFWIEQLDSFKNGYNLTIGGEGSWGRKHTAEAREKMSIANKGNKIWLGRKHTPESLKKISVAGKGKIISDITKQKRLLTIQNKSDEQKIQTSLALSKQVYSIDRVFNSVGECANFFGEPYNSMKKYLTGCVKMPKRLLPFDLHYFGTVTNKGRNLKKVFSTEKIFDSVKECAEYFNVKYITMRCYINGNKKMPQRLLKYNLHYLNEEREEVERIV